MFSRRELEGDNSTQPRAAAAAEGLSSANAECDQLRARVRQLEEELAQVRAQRDAYRPSFYAEIRSALSESDWRHLGEPEDEQTCMSLDQFDELEEVVNRETR